MPWMRKFYTGEGLNIWLSDELHHLLELLSAAKNPTQGLCYLHGLEVKPDTTDVLLTLDNPPLAGPGLGVAGGVARVPPWIIHLSTQRGSWQCSDGLTWCRWGSWWRSRRSCWSSPRSKSQNLWHRSLEPDLPCHYTLTEKLCQVLVTQSILPTPVTQVPVRPLEAGHSRLGNVVIWKMLETL